MSPCRIRWSDQQSVGSGKDIDVERAAVPASRRSTSSRAGGRRVLRSGGQALGDQVGQVAPVRHRAQAAFRQVNVDLDLSPAVARWRGTRSNRAGTARDTTVVARPSNAALPSTETLMGTARPPVQALGRCPSTTMLPRPVGAEPGTSTGAPRLAGACGISPTARGRSQPGGTAPAGDPRGRGGGRGRRPRPRVGPDRSPVSPPCPASHSACTVLGTATTRAGVGGRAQSPAIAGSSDVGDLAQQVDRLLHVADKSPPVISSSSSTSASSSPSPSRGSQRWARVGAACLGLRSRSATCRSRQMPSRARKRRATCPLGHQGSGCGSPIGPRRW